MGRVLKGTVAEVMERGKRGEKKNICVVINSEGTIMSLVLMDENCKLERIIFNPGSTNEMFRGAEKISEKGKTLSGKVTENGEEKDFTVTLEDDGIGFVLIDKYGKEESLFNPGPTQEIIISL